MKIISGPKKIAVFCFFFFWLTVFVTGFSQVGDPGTDPDVPISGIEWLLLGGGIFGARKLFKRIKEK
jgi:hypothetical protein